MRQTSSALVIDASVIVKWFIPGEVLEEDATDIYQQFRSGVVELFAPDHIFNELASAITFASRGRSARLSAQDAREILSQAIELDIRTVQTTELLLPAFDLVHRHGASIYDSMYLALSDALPASLVTADERFYNVVNAQHDVLWLGDLPTQ
ncbi:MAG: PIN domain-containing protein [Sphaerobacteraceae bacterium]|nr:MAG: PIN domain-containing protein [Sphaerobacteraceae bacterium]